VGQRLESRREDLGLAGDVAIREFVGSPLGLIQAMGESQTVILVDSMTTGTHKVGSVVVFGMDEILGSQADAYLHGMNLAESLALARRWGVGLPRTLTLVGIEVGRITGFGVSVSSEVAAVLEAIYAEAERIIVGLLTQRRGDD
jgi:hydrogenase maturation protease